MNEQTEDVTSRVVHMREIKKRIFNDKYNTKSGSMWFKNDFKSGDFVLESLPKEKIEILIGK